MISYSRNTGLNRTPLLFGNSILRKNNNPPIFLLPEVPVFNEVFLKKKWDTIKENEMDKSFIDDFKKFVVNTLRLKE